MKLKKKINKPKQTLITYLLLRFLVIVCMVAQGMKVTGKTFYYVF